MWNFIYFILVFFFLLHVLYGNRHNLSSIDRDKWEICCCKSQTDWPLKKERKKKRLPIKILSGKKKLKKKITTNPDYTKKENEYLIRNIYLVCVCVCVSSYLEGRERERRDCVTTLYLLE